MKTMGIVSALALVLVACSDGTEPTPTSADEVEEHQVVGADLAEIIAHERRNEKRARDEWRHPLETLTFFGIEPDMTIVEVLPGNGGWYTQILNPYTAEQGRLIGVTYPESLWTQLFSTWNERQPGEIRCRYCTDGPVHER